MQPLNDSDKTQAIQSSPVYRELTLLLDLYLHPTETELQNSPSFARVYNYDTWNETYQGHVESFAKEIKNIDPSSQGWLIDSAFSTFYARLQEATRDGEMIVGPIKGQFLTSHTDFCKDVIYDLYRTHDLSSDLSSGTKALLGLDAFSLREVEHQKHIVEIVAGDKIEKLGRVDSLSRGVIQGEQNLIFVQFENGKTKSFPDDAILTVTGLLPKSSIETTRSNLAEELIIEQFLAEHKLSVPATHDRKEYVQTMYQQSWEEWIQEKFVDGPQKKSEVIIPEIKVSLNNNNLNQSIMAKEKNADEVKVTGYISKKIHYEHYPETQKSFLTAAITVNDNEVHFIKAVNRNAERIHEAVEKEGIKRFTIIGRSQPIEGEKAKTEILVNELQKHEVKEISGKITQKESKDIEDKKGKKTTLLKLLVASQTIPEPGVVDEKTYNVTVWPNALKGIPENVKLEVGQSIAIKGEVSTFDFQNGKKGYNLEAWNVDTNLKNLEKQIATKVEASKAKGVEPQLER